MYFYTVDCILLSNSFGNIFCIWLLRKDRDKAEAPHVRFAALARGVLDFSHKGCNLSSRAIPGVPWERLARFRVARSKRRRLLRSSGFASCTLRSRWKQAARRCAGRRLSERPL